MVIDIYKIEYKECRQKKPAEIWQKFMRHLNIEISVFV